MVVQTTNIKDSPVPVNEIYWVIPCWLCGDPVQVKFSRKDKPYLICDSCGVQTFIRYGKAEDLLIAKVRQYRKAVNDGEG